MWWLLLVPLGLAGTYAALVVLMLNAPCDLDAR